MIPAINLIEVTKVFGDLVACDKVSFSVQRGSVHAVVGENGAGKSTIMKIVFGMYRRTSGTIEIHGEPVDFGDPSEAIRRKIFMVHQHFMQIPTMTVAENIILGDEKTSIFGEIRMDQSIFKIEDICRKHGLEISLNKKISELSVGEQQRVEILSALFRGAEILILDEPTSVLTPKEVQEFFETVQLLISSGKSIILITHKLDEVMAISNEITVMRAGQVTGRMLTEDASIPKITSLMVGREVHMNARNPAVNPPGEERLELKDIRIRDHGREILRGINLSVRSGEIVGIAGIAGNGQQELEDVISGKINKYEGVMSWKGQPVSHFSPAKARLLNMGHVPTDREEEGYIHIYPNWLNLIFGYQHKPDYVDKWGNLRTEAIKTSAEELHDKFNIMPKDINKLTTQLSGGNKQKLVVAREFSQSPEFIIICNPTRGVDISAIEFIHEEIFKLRDRGTAILVISSELSEIIALSDRAYVLHKGKLEGQFDPADADPFTIGLMMVGQSLSHEEPKRFSEQEVMEL